MRMRHDGGGAAAATRLKFFPAGLNVAAKPCDYCKSTAALLFCRAEVAFMCIGCDAKVHEPDASEGVRLRHERVWMCEVCEHAPAAVTCKADAAALCVTCDRDIHSANPLASRHDRVAVVPFYDAVGYETGFFARKLDENGYVPSSDSWIAAAAKLPVDTPDLKAMELLFQDSEQFLDFDASYQIPAPPFTDSIVPVQAAAAAARSPENRFEIDFTRSNINSYNNGSFTTPSLSHSVSSSSLDVGIVPDGSSLSETSYPFVRNIDPTATQVVGMDREARVLRYKEKRKNRKFEKTIRYASRKAYAETRPRIKGRFAKRADSDSDSDRVFAVRFGVVPSF